MPIDNTTRQGQVGQQSDETEHKGDLTERAAEGATDDNVREVAASQVLESRVNGDGKFGKVAA